MTPTVTDPVRYGLIAPLYYPGLPIWLSEEEYHALSFGKWRYKKHE